MMKKSSSNKRGRGGERAFERMFTEAPPHPPGAEAQINQKAHQPVSQVVPYCCSLRVLLLLNSHLAPCRLCHLALAGQRVDWNNLHCAEH